LSGSYFVQQVPGYDHTCKVEFEGSRPVATITFQLSARDAFYVERVEDGLSKRSHGDEKSQAIEEMRRKISGMVVEKLLRSDGILANDELVLAHLEATARRSTPTDDVVARPRVRERGSKNDKAKKR
jgi:hypothetical protein